MQDRLIQDRAQIRVDFYRHWQLADLGHRESHFEEVEQCANHINNVLGLGLDPYLLMLGAWFHDLFCWSRNNHHLMIREWLTSTDYPLIRNLKPNQLLTLAQGCLEHRASYKGIYSSEFSEVLSAADRGFPTTDMELKLQRPIEYRLHEGFCPKAAREGAILHLKKKYGHGGYARYNKVWLQVFEKELPLMQDAIAKL